jgi:hypothetical protein
MTRAVPRRRLWLELAPAALAVLIGLPPPLAAQAQPETACQVTLFAIVAVPGSNTIDPKLQGIQTQLRKLLPGYGFKLLDVRSKRLGAGESIRCDLQNGLTASTVLVRPLDENGKVELRCALWLNGIVQFDTLVATPPNQLFFCDRMLDDGTRLLIGVGAR